MTLLTDVTILKFAMLARMRSRRRSRPGNGLGPASGQTSTPTASRARRPAGGLAGAVRPGRPRCSAGTARLIGASGHAVTVEVKISDEVMPGVISLPHGWGHDLPGIHLEVAARRPGANLNALLDENLRDPLSGNAVLSGVPVRLEPHRQPRRGGIVKPGA